MTDTCEGFLWYLSGQMLCRIVEHSRADTVFPACAMQHIHVDTTLAAFSESLVFRQVGEGDGLIA